MGVSQSAYIPAPDLGIECFSREKRYGELVDSDQSQRSKSFKSFSGLVNNIHLVYWQPRLTNLRVLNFGYECQATGGNEWYHK